jgi:hypothetical protein
VGPTRAGHGVSDLPDRRRLSVLLLRRTSHGPQQRAVTATTGWQRHSVVLPVDPRAHTVIFGALLVGEGELRVADLAFEEVAAEVAVTGPGFAVPAAPRNLDFTDV